MNSKLDQSIMLNWEGKYENQWKDNFSSKVVD